MDLVDLHILKAMGVRYFGPTASDRAHFNPVTLAERVGLDQKTVRTRIDRLRATGFLLGFDLYPNIRLFGRKEGVCYFRDITPEEKEAAFSRLEEMDGLMEAHDFYRGPLCVNFTYEGDPHARVDEIAAVVGRPGELVALGNGPDVEGALTTIDWRIMAVLRHDALMPAIAVAEHLEVAVKTVRRRLAHLTAAGAYYIFPRLDPTKADGLLFANVAVWPQEDQRTAVLQRTREVVGPHTILEMDPGAGNCLAVAGVRNPAEAEQLERALLRTNGVERAETYLLQAMVDYAGWIDEALEERVGPEVLLVE